MLAGYQGGNSFELAYLGWWNRETASGLSCMLNYVASIICIRLLSLKTRIERFFKALPYKNINWFGSYLNSII